MRDQRNHEPAGEPVSHDVLEHAVLHLVLRRHSAQLTFDELVRAAGEPALPRPSLPSIRITCGYGCAQTCASSTFEKSRSEIRSRLHHPEDLGACRSRAGRPCAHVSASSALARWQRFLTL